MRNWFVVDCSICRISREKFRFFYPVFSCVWLMVLVSILRRKHHHHSLHELNITHLTVFADSHNCSSFAFWMFISAILASAAGSEFAFNVRVEEQAFLSVWAGREVFALFCWVNKWTIIIGATWEKFTSYLFFYYTLFCFLLLYTLLMSLILETFNLVISVVFVDYVTWGFCVESLHSFLPFSVWRCGECQIIFILIIGISGRYFLLFLFRLVLLCFLKVWAYLLFFAQILFI